MGASSPRDSYDCSAKETRERCMKEGRPCCPDPNGEGDSMCLEKGETCPQSAMVMDRYDCSAKETRAPLLPRPERGGGFGVPREGGDLPPVRCGDLKTPSEYRPEPRAVRFQRACGTNFFPPQIVCLCLLR